MLGCLVFEWALGWVLADIKKSEIAANKLKLESNGCLPWKN